MALLNFPMLYIPDPTKGRPLFHGQIFVGEPDLDPEDGSGNPVNSKQLSVIQEDGTVVAVSQPFILGAGGVPTYNGATVSLDVTGNYSLKILDKNGAQVYYVHNVQEATGGGSSSSIVKIEKEYVLDDGQVVVDTVGITASSAEFYIGKTSGDRGLIFEPDDYSVTDVSEITLTRSYDAGTKILAISSALVGTSEAYVQNFLTLDEYRANTTLLTVGSLVYINETGSNYTVIDGTSGANIYDIIASNTEDQSIELIVPPNTPLNPRVLGATDGIGADDAESLIMRNANSTLLNFAFEKYKDSGIYIDMTIRTYGSVMLRAGQTVIGVNRDVAGIIGYHPTESTFIDDTLDSSGEGNNTTDMHFEELTLQSQLSGSVFHFTPYRSLFRRNNIRCVNGIGFYLHDGGYQVGNTWELNNFNGCLYGVEGLGGDYNPTDNYFINNTFFADDITINHIRISNASGSTFRGNHYSGGAQGAYVRISSSLNIRFIGEYFEYNEPSALADVSNPHIEIFGGSTPTFTFTGCDFWKGNGDWVDYNGDPSCSIKIELSLFNKFDLSVSSCAFSGGSGSLPIFGFTNGSVFNSTEYRVIFDRSNIVQGTYTLVGRLTDDCTLASNVVQTDHPYFMPVVSTYNGNYTGTSGGEIYSTYGETGLTTVTLPATTAWLVDKPFVINNVSTVCELSFSAGGGLVIGGLNPTPTSTRVKVIKDITGSYDYLVTRA